MKLQFSRKVTDIYIYIYYILILLCAALTLGACGIAEQSKSVRSVPVLMYHHLDAEGNGGTVISVENFESQIRVLAQAGYTPVSVREMIDFVHSGGELPKKPVCISFDDGYESNFTLAGPILEKYGMKATVFCIGSSIGKSTYKDSGEPITPHFSMQEALEMSERGTFSLESHSWDMHQSEKLESGTARTCIQPLDGETDEAFAAAVKADCEKQRRYFTENGFPAPEALAYPLGAYSELSEKVLHSDCGILATFTTDPDGTNTLERGRPESLYLLHRLNMTDGVSADALLDYLKTYS